MDYNRRPALRTLPNNVQIPVNRADPKKGLAVLQPADTKPELSKPVQKTKLLQKLSERCTQDSRALDDKLFEDYGEDHFKTLESTEKTLVQKKNFLEDTVLNVAKRYKVVDWLMKTQHRLGISDNEFYTAVKIMDSTLKLCSNYEEVTLLSLTSLWMAHKLGANTGISVSRITRSISCTVTSQDVLQMERKILVALNYSLSLSEPSAYLELYLRKLKVIDEKLIYHGSYFVCDCLSLFPKFSYLEPSLIAIISIYTSVFVMYGDPKFVLALIKSDQQTYVKNSCDDCLRKISYMLKIAQKEPFVKYSGASRSKVSVIFESFIPSIVMKH